MTYGFTVQADELARRGAEYAEVAATVTAIQRAAADAAAAYRGCWGDDQAGSFFAMQYSPGETQVLRQLADAATELDKLSEAIVLWASRYPATDAGLR